ncbi:hypothetical protein DPMN_000902 [Dreissena polymorpha]|uniref:Uncharacterized protein n=1 Tax=Dreissena polymorpha TaxID=45954 RepID=A0A9D4MKN6_DREPO|nr:hypothetical protein DPMN_000902 [Dreissena polymorpha]
MIRTKIDRVCLPPCVLLRRRPNTDSLQAAEACRFVVVDRPPGFLHDNCGHSVMSTNGRAVAYWICYPPSDREVTGSIPTVGAFFRSPPKILGSRLRKRTRERFDVIELK